MRHPPQNLPSVGVLGVGAVTALGRDVPEIGRLLAEPPSSAPGPRRVHDASLVYPPWNSRLRRADRFVRMAAIAALDAWTDAQRAAGDVPAEHIGLILASGFGSHVRAFRFLDGMLDFGDAAALPTDFSHSLHGTATAYIAELLALRGPSLTITDFESGVAQALLQAQCWLAQGRCQRVLVGAVEELGEVLLHYAAKLLGDSRFLPGEGAVFFMLGSGDVPGRAHLNVVSPTPHVDLLLLDDPPLRAAPANLPPSAHHTATCSPYFGQSAGSAAFQLLGGLLSLQAGRPLGRILTTADAQAPAGAIDSAAAFVPSSMPDARLVLLSHGGT